MQSAWCGGQLPSAAVLLVGGVGQPGWLNVPPISAGWENNLHVLFVCLMLVFSRAYTCG